MKVDTIFCDDVREEINNKHSFIGVYDKEIIVKKFPTLLPKFFIVNRIKFKKNETPPKEIFIKLTFPGGETEVTAKIEKKKNTISQDEFVSINGEFSPFILESEGIIEAKIKADGKRFFSSGKLLVHKHKHKNKNKNKK